MKITVNCVSVETDKSSLSYEEICELAGKKPEHNPSCVYHVRLNGDAERNGSLTHGKSVELANGMHISCMVTGSS